MTNAEARDALAVRMSHVARSLSAHAAAHRRAALKEANSTVPGHACRSWIHGAERRAYLNAAAKIREALK